MSEMASSFNRTASEQLAFCSLPLTEAISCTIRTYNRSLTPCSPVASLRVSLASHAGESRPRQPSFEQGEVALPHLIFRRKLGKALDNVPAMSQGVVGFGSVIRFGKSD